MDKLKQALFKEALYQKRQYQRARKIFGEWDTLTYFHETNFKALYNVIVEGECENEYLAWVEMQKNNE